jgi:uncharacterized tellurite resistance protein B-like protein
MPAASTKLDLLESLKSDIGIADEVSDQVIELTPHLALAVALLYMIASDGEVEEQESSQLQAVLGGDKEVLRYGLAYVKSTSIEQFLQDAPEVLNHKDALCILTNVCDSLLSDGHADDEELALFYRMVTAFGSTQNAFAPYYKTISLKNDKTVLGVFKAGSEEIAEIGPHHALAIALLYMMTADGSIGSAEIGQLEAVIGEYPGLQKAALRYVRQNKVKQFLDQATSALSTAQRLCILTNVCDSMLSDGNVALLENKLFQTILTAFGYDESSFEPYYQTIEIKNVKSFDTRAFVPKMTHRRSRETDKGYQATADVYTTAANQEVWSDGAGNASSMGAMIQRTMQENIEHVVEDFGSNANVIQVSHNATDELNVQQLAQSLSADNLQHIDGAVDAAENRQTIDVDVDKANRQTLSTTTTDINVQTFSLAEVDDNRQSIDSTQINDHQEEISLEVRMQSLYEDIDGLNQRLSRFESENKDFLDAIRAEMMIDVAGVVKDISPEEQELLNMVNGFLSIDNVQEIPLANGDDNLQQIAWNEDGNNVQQVPIAAATENVQEIAIARTRDNIQDIALDRETENIQTITSVSTQPNRQRLFDAKGLNAIDLNGQDHATDAAKNLTHVPHAESGMHEEDTDTDASQASAPEMLTQAGSSAARHGPNSSMRPSVAMGRVTPFGLKGWYTHAKLAIVFVMFVFAMPMDAKLPTSRITSGFLVTLTSHAGHVNTEEREGPLDEHVAQEKIVEEVEQTFDLVRLKRD